MAHPVLGVDREADQTSLVVCRQVVRLVVDRSVCRSDGWSVGLSVIMHLYTVETGKILLIFSLSVIGKHYKM